MGATFETPCLSSKFCCRQMSSEKGKGNVKSIYWKTISADAKSIELW